MSRPPSVYEAPPVMAGMMLDAAAAVSQLIRHHWRDPRSDVDMYGSAGRLVAEATRVGEGYLIPLVAAANLAGVEGPEWDVEGAGDAAQTYEPYLSFAARISTDEGKAVLFGDPLRYREIALTATGNFTSVVNWPYSDVLRHPLSEVAAQARAAASREPQIGLIAGTRAQDSLKSAEVCFSQTLSIRVCANSYSAVSLAWDGQLGEVVVPAGHLDRHPYLEILLASFGFSRVSVGDWEVLRPKTSW